MIKLRSWLLLAGVAVTVLGGTSGCNPFGMGIATPIPVQPWMGQMVEDRLNNPADHNTIVMPPIPAGYRPLCEDPPDRATILRAMPPVARGIPYVYEEFRDDLDFTVERMVDQIDPPRFIPLVGPAQVHHCHYKCTVYYTETLMSEYPLPIYSKHRRVEVIHIDRDHLHMYACTPEQMQSMTTDLTQYQP